MFFPGEFTFNQPWGEDNFIQHLPPKYDKIKQPDYRINVQRVAHITHYDRAERIISSGLKFQAQPKSGSKGYSYIINDAGTFTPIDNSMFIPCSGYFSWWGIERNVYENPDDKDLMKTCKDLGVSFKPSYLFRSNSMYGTVKLSLEFTNLLDSYVCSFQGEKKLVRYKRGGTLRYGKEVCYVIMVCVFENGEDPLPIFPNLDDLSNLVIKQSASYFYIGSIKKSVPVSWDHYVFALYYPNNHPTKCLTLNPFDVKITEAKHDKTFCHLVIRNYVPICPDYEKFEIPLKDLQDMLNKQQIQTIPSQEKKQKKEESKSEDNY